MKHKILLIITTCLVFIMICVVSLKELFSVKDITVVYSVTTNSVTDEVQALLQEYTDENIFAVDLNEIKEKITANLYLKVVSVEKNYPNEIIVRLTERTEKYFYVASDATYYFDDEYFVVRSSEFPPENQEYLTEIFFTDTDNSEIKVDCSLKSYFEFPNGYHEDINTIISQTASVSTNLQKISFITTKESGNYRVRLFMREGVVIEIRKAGELLTEKINQGINCYNNLEEQRKIQGAIIVLLEDNGKISAKHSY